MTATLEKELEIKDGLGLAEKIDHWYNHDNQLTGFLSGIKIEIFEEHSRVLMKVGAANAEEGIGLYDIESVSQYFPRAKDICRQLKGKVTYFLSKESAMFLQAPRAEAQRKAQKAGIKTQEDAIKYARSLLRS